MHAGTAHYEQCVEHAMLTGTFVAGPRPARCRGARRHQNFDLDTVAAGRSSSRPARGRPESAMPKAQRSRPIQYMYYYYPGST